MVLNNRFCAQLIAISALFFVFNSSVLAYNLLGISWPNASARYDLDTRSNLFDAAFIEAMGKWNGRSNFEFTNRASGSFDPCGSNPDGRNSYRFSSNNCGKGWNSSTLAVTTIWFDNNNNAIDTDIVLNSGNYNWGVHNGNNNPKIDFRRVAVHELGHALGLGHEFSNPAIMQPSISNTIIDPQPDDISGMLAIYGIGGGGDDFFPKNSTLSSTTVLPNNTLIAQTEQHYVGASSTTLNPKLGYYLSTNTTLGGSDQILGEAQSTLSASDTQDSESNTIRIPASTVPGSYYILFVADFDNRFFETNENNNVQAVGVTVVTPQVTLSVSISGSGSVTSSPSGINCPTDCSQQYSQGTNVSLTPIPLQGWVFSGWSGACSGLGSCVVSMTSNKSASASFEKQGVVITPMLFLLLDE
jgi:hypothetical protein